MASESQCREFIEEKSDEKLSEGARDYACGLLQRAGAEPSNLPEDRTEKLLNRAESWEEGTFGEFRTSENQQQPQNNQSSSQEQQQAQPQAEPVEAPSGEQETLEEEA